MSGYWTINNRGAAGVAATGSTSAPTSALLNGLQIRLRALQVSLAGTVAGTDEVVVRDGATGVGTVLWSADLSIVTNGSETINLADLDIRASAGNALTVEFVSGVGSDRENVNAQGDYVPVGYPLGMI